MVTLNDNTGRSVTLYTAKEVQQLAGRLGRAISTTFQVVNGSVLFRLNNNN